MKSLKGKIALITGSSRGIGQQIAYGLAKLGCDVILHGRELKNLNNTEKMISNFGVKIYKVAGDLATPEGIKSVIDGVFKVTPYIDILYNNAAIMNKWMPIEKIPLEEWLNTFQVNIFAMISLCNAFVPKMKERKFGRVINLTSGIKETPALAPYGVSKAAIDKYSQELAADCKGTNVLVNYLDPGWLKTDMGGPNAMFEVETVLPGALVPALLEDNGPTGRLFCAQDFKYLTI
ncbi:MAG: SDR family oxidoreductase [Chitinispirillaceae bacterium]|nr:SDR family oxidoreductase [Chitinispirillaceae bacterium]